jgi:KDO2-lipid IV(A) lauroyltransferase
MKERVEYYLVKFFIYFLGLLPKTVIYKFTHFLAMTFFKFEKRRSSLTLKNLALAFPDKSEQELYELAKKTYTSLSISIAEIIMMFNDRIDIEQMIENKEESLATLRTLIQNNQNGTIFITAHFSNWELLAQFLPKNGFPMTVIGREGNNKLIEVNFTTPFREKFGNENIYKRNSLIKLIKLLKQNKNVGFLIDQKAGGTASFKARFFNHPADTTTSVALLVLKYNPLVIPIFMPRLKNGKYHLKIIETSQDETATIESLTQKYNDILEEVIKEYPEQWFWMHNRWRLPK